MTASTTAGLLAVALLAACSGGPPEAKSFAADSLQHPKAAPKLPDSLALRAPDGTEIWFTDARSAKAASGEDCIERVMQLRHDSTRVAIPLLYTAEVPRMVNDTLAETHIFLNCKPGNLYRINLRNGQPIYVGLQ
jgi:hypothetical protein